MVKTMKLKGGSSRPPDPVDELADLHAQAARIEGAKRDAALIKASISAIREAQVQPLELRLAKLQESIDGGMDYIRQTLLKQPKDHQKLLRGNATYYIIPGRESVEVMDEEKALAEVKALGPIGKPCVQVKESLSKSALKALLQNTEAPKLEYARLTRGESVLAVKEA